MLEFAVVDAGLDPDVYYALTWYEFRLMIKRYHKQERKETLNQELEWHRFRIQWADFRNAHSRKGKTVKPTDLIKLSFDKENESVAVAPDIEAVKKRFGKQIKKRKNGK